MHIHAKVMKTDETAMHFITFYVKLTLSLAALEHVIILFSSLHHTTEVETCMGVSLAVRRTR